MNWLKSTTFIAFAFCTLALTSCEKKTTTPEETCDAPDVPQNIIGFWIADMGTSVVEFRTNGDLIDPDDDIIGGFINTDTFSVKSYIATNDSLYVKAASATTSNFIDATFPVSGNECDKITLDFIGIPFALTRDN